LALGVLAFTVLMVVVAGSRRASLPPRPAAGSRTLTAGRAPTALGPPTTPPAPTPAVQMVPVTSPPPPLSLEAGLVSHWSFDEGAGSAVARDLSGRGHDCVLHAVDPAQAWGAGRVGGAVRLHAHGWIECPQPATATRQPVALTVAFWAIRLRAGKATTFVHRELPLGTSPLFHFALLGDTLQLWSGAWSRTTRYALEAPLSGWVHLAFTHAGRTTKIFIDGTLVVQRDDTPPKPIDLVTTAPLVVGALVRDPSRVWQHLDGAVDDLRFYDRALSDAEIEALATLGR
jgi:hypothetical protein